MKSRTVLQVLCTVLATVTLSAAASDKGKAHRSDRAAERTSIPNNGTATAAEKAAESAIANSDGGFARDVDVDVAAGLEPGTCGCYIDGIDTGTDYDMTESNCYGGDGWVWREDAEWIFVESQGVCTTASSAEVCQEIGDKHMDLTDGNTLCVYSTQEKEPVKELTK